MSTNPLQPENSIAPEQPAIDLPTDALKLGVDGEGSRHHYSRIAHAVVAVTPAGHVERHEQLGERRLGDWIAYVDDKRGWESVNYRGTFAEVVAEALEVEA